MATASKDNEVRATRALQGLAILAVGVGIGAVLDRGYEGAVKAEATQMVQQMAPASATPGK